MATRLVDPDFAVLSELEAKDAAPQKYDGKKFGTHIFSTLKAAVAAAFPGDNIVLKHASIPIGKIPLVLPGGGPPPNPDPWKQPPYTLFTEDRTLAWDNHSTPQFPWPDGKMAKAAGGGPVGVLSGWSEVGKDAGARAAWYTTAGAAELKAFVFPHPKSGMRAYVAQVVAYLPNGASYLVKQFLFNAHIGKQSFKAYQEIGFLGNLSSPLTVNQQLDAYLKGNSELLKLEPSAAYFTLNVVELSVYFAKFQTYLKPVYNSDPTAAQPSKVTDGGESWSKPLTIAAAFDAPATIVLDGGSISAVEGIRAVGGFHHVVVHGLGFTGFDTAIRLMEDGATPHNWQILACDFYDTKRYQIDKLPLSITLNGTSVVVTHTEPQLGAGIFTGNYVYDVLVKDCTFADFGWPVQVQSIPDVIEQVEHFCKVLDSVKKFMKGEAGATDIGLKLDAHLVMAMLDWDKNKDNPGLLKVQALTQAEKVEKARQAWDHLTWHMNLGIYLRGCGVTVRQDFFYNMAQGLPIKVDGYDLNNAAAGKTIRVHDCEFWGGIPAPLLGIAWANYQNPDPPTGNWHAPWLASDPLDSTISFSGLVNVVRTAGSNAGPAKTEFEDSNFYLPGRELHDGQWVRSAVRTTGGLGQVNYGKASGDITKLGAFVQTPPLVFAGLTLRLRPLIVPLDQTKCSMVEYFVQGWDPASVIPAVLVRQGAISAAVAAAKGKLDVFADAHAFEWTPGSQKVAYYKPVAKGQVAILLYLDLIEFEEKLLTAAYAQLPKLVTNGSKDWTQWTIDKGPWAAGKNRIYWTAVYKGVTNPNFGDKSVAFVLGADKGPVADFMLVETKAFSPK